MSMADRDGVIWYDGKLVPWREATTHVLTHTLHYGMGVFEGVRAYKAEQGTRDFFACRSIPTGCFRSAHHPRHDNCRMTKHDFRSTAYRGCAKRTRIRLPAPDGVFSVRKRWAFRRKTCRCTSSSPPGHGERIWAERWIKASASRPARSHRHHVNITMCKAKANGNYINSILAHKEAETDGYDEALLLDVDGFVLKVRVKTFS